MPIQAGRWRFPSRPDTLDETGPRYIISPPPNSCEWLARSTQPLPAGWSLPGVCVQASSSRVVAGPRLRGERPSCRQRSRWGGRMPKWLQVQPRASQRPADHSTWGGELTDPPRPGRLGLGRRLCEISRLVSRAGRVTGPLRNPRVCRTCRCRTASYPWRSGQSASPPPAARSGFGGGPLPRCDAG